VAAPVEAPDGERDPVAVLLSVEAPEALNTKLRVAVAVPAALCVAVCVPAAVGGAVALPVSLSVGAADAPGSMLVEPLLVAVALTVAATDAALDPVVVLLSVEALEALNTKLREAVVVPALLCVAVCVSAAMGGAVTLPVPLSVGAADAPGTKLAGPLLVAMPLTVEASDAVQVPVSDMGAVPEGVPVAGGVAKLLGEAPAERMSVREGVEVGERVGMGAGSAPPPAHQKPASQPTPEALVEPAGHHEPGGAAHTPEQLEFSWSPVVLPNLPLGQGAGTPLRHHEPSGQGAQVALLITRLLDWEKVISPWTEATIEFGWLRFTSAPKPTELPVAPDPATVVTTPRTTSMRRTRCPAISVTNTASPDMEHATPTGLLKAAEVAGPSANAATPSVPASVATARLDTFTQRTRELARSATKSRVPLKETARP
jgi:hypothetical protein